MIVISIHAPREGGDGIIEQERFYVLAISIHAPREGGDPLNISIVPHLLISIHAPREGGDNSTGHPGENKCDFNPRPPRGGRLFGLRSPLRVRLFQSTPPARGATSADGQGWAMICISIHAPREGGDVIVTEGLI